MHDTVVRFLHDSTRHVNWTGADVIEIGAYNVNGQARDHVTGWHSWTGIDLKPGPGVDLVGDATTILPTLGPYDIVVCCEVLEHAATWPTLVAAMWQSVRFDGWLIVTCAGPGREPHSMVGGPDPGGEHYANITLDELVAAVPGQVIVGVEEVGDTRLIVQRSRGTR